MIERNCALFPIYHDWTILASDWMLNGTQTALNDAQPRRINLRKLLVTESSPRKTPPGEVRRTRLKAIVADKPKLLPGPLLRLPSSRDPGHPCRERCSLGCNWQVVVWRSCQCQLQPILRMKNPSTFRRCRPWFVAWIVLANSLNWMLARIRVCFVETLK